MFKDRRGIFITATGTDVGKTYVSALLVKFLRSKGIKCGYYKPVLSGLSADIVNDVEYVKNISGGKFVLSKNCSYFFEDAVSPHLAAQRCGVDISLDKILQDYVRLSKEYECVVVEGAGGITCPLGLKEKNLLLPDVIKTLGLNVLVVADGGLGTINSTMLTCEYARSQDIKVKGIILNNFDSSNFMHQDNLIQIENLTGIEVLATVKKGAQQMEIDERILKGLFD